MLDSRDRIRRRACDECSKSKVRCSGEDPSCSRCIQRALPCFYPLKRKRGFGDPEFGASGANGEDYDDLGQEATSNAARNSSSSASLDLSSLTMFERKCWTAFFTLFRNQQRHRDENPVSYCWFATQLCRLNSFFVKKNRNDLVEKLNNWLLASNVNPQTLTSSLKFNCRIMPNSCSECAMNALGFDRSKGIYKVKGEPVSWHQHCSQCSAVSSNNAVESKKADKAGLVEQVFGDAFDSEEPFVHFYTNEHGTEYGFKVNDSFVAQIGFTEEELTQALSWTGGSDGLAGFLPWFGDFFACLLVREKDLLSFLQILAIKYQTAGDLAHDESDHSRPRVRDTPTAHNFEVRTNFMDPNEPGSSNKREIIRCAIQTVHRERLENGVLVIEMFAKIIPMRGKNDAPRKRLKSVSSQQEQQQQQLLPLTSLGNFPSPNGVISLETPLSVASEANESDKSDMKTGGDDTLFAGFFVDSLPDTLKAGISPIDTSFSDNKLRGTASTTNTSDDAEFLQSLLDWSGPYNPTPSQLSPSHLSPDASRMGGKNAASSA